MPLKRRDGELILDWLEEIGLAWVKDGDQICGEMPSEKLNRFKLYQQSMMSVGISLWYGTALLIPCDDVAFPSDEEIGWYKKDSGGKELLITISIYVGKARGSSNIIKEFHTYVVDDIHILPSEYWNYKYSFSSLDNLQKFLKEIREILN